MRVAELFAWMRERHSIYEKRQRGLPKPWTRDPILQAYKFTNVYRELDTVTVWLRENWREPFADHPNLWFAMALARAINWPDTLAEIGFPKTWNPERVRDAMAARASRGEKVYTGAYMLRSDAMDKPSYTCFKVLDPLWRGKVKPFPGETLESYHATLSAQDGWGSFLAGQVVCDLKYTRWLKDANDWHAWAASGPGSRRGLNRVLGRPVDAPWSEREWLLALMELHVPISHFVKKAKMPPLHAQDLQNCLCEFDKYERVRLGEGRPRSGYPGKV